MIDVRCAALTASALAGDSSVTAPAPARAAAMADSRAAPVDGGPPENTPTWPRAYLWVSVAGDGSRCSQFARIVFEAGRADRRENVIANADVGDDDLAAIASGRDEADARASCERRSRSPRRAARCRARRRSGPTRRSAGRRRRRARRPRRAWRSPRRSRRPAARQAGPEQRIDDQPALCRREFGERPRWHRRIRPPRLPRRCPARGGSTRHSVTSTPACRNSSAMT